MFHKNMTSLAYEYLQRVNEFHVLEGLNLCFLSNVNKFQQEFKIPERIDYRYLLPFCMNTHRYIAFVVNCMKWREIWNSIFKAGADFLKIIFVLTS